VTAQSRVKFFPLPFHRRHVHAQAIYGPMPEELQHAAEEIQAEAAETRSRIASVTPVESSVGAMIYSNDSHVQVDHPGGFTCGFLVVFEPAE
jgi:hypothetical protein